ncbi:MAG TPA: hypothetical protein VLK34_09415 [Nocardioidaceae bacterium]|nr:hypothetical protein [Nocardioidaceae bacterium]
MPLLKTSLLAVPVLVAGLVVAAPPSDAGPTTPEIWKVVSVDQVGCTDGAFTMTVRFANLDMTGGYTAHTMVTGGGKTYMNEDAGSPPNGTEDWSFYNQFSYGPTPHQGTWPIPHNLDLRADFRLERPKGTVLYSWSLAIDGCHTGNILYDGPTSADVDADNVPVPRDRCPKVKGLGQPNGCPLVGRRLTLSYSDRAAKFHGTLLAPRGPKLARHQSVTVWLARSGPDLRIGKDLTDRRGKYVVAKVAADARYYATAPPVLKPSAGKAEKEKSRSIHAP